MYDVCKCVCLCVCVCVCIACPENMESVQSSIFYDNALNSFEDGIIFPFQENVNVLTYNLTYDEPVAVSSYLIGIHIKWNTGVNLEYLGALQTLGELLQGLTIGIRFINDGKQFVFFLFL